MAYLLSRIILEQQLLDIPNKSAPGVSFRVDKTFRRKSSAVLSKGVTMRTYVALVVAALFGLAVPVLGQQTAGDTELQLQGSLFLGGSDDMGTVSVVIGRFFTDRQEVGLKVDGIFIADGKFGGFGGPNYRYNFSTGNIVPYVGAEVGTTFGDFGNATTTIATGEGGVRYFVDRSTAFTAAATKTYFFKQKEFDKGVTITFGFSHLWGK